MDLVAARDFMAASQQLIQFAGEIELIAFTQTLNAWGEETDTTPRVLRTSRGRISPPRDMDPRPYEGGRPAEEMLWTVEMPRDVDLTGAQAYGVKGTCAAFAAGQTAVLLYRVGDNVSGSFRSATILSCRSSNTIRPDFL
jgi:hypothetical protein